MALYDVIDYVAGICEGVTEGLDPQPFVGIGGSPQLKPFMCHVGEVPRNLTVTDPASSGIAAMGGRTCGDYRCEFDVSVTLWADRADLVGTCRMVMGWFELIARAVAADRTLGGRVEHAQPYYSSAWTSSNQKKTTYLVAVECGVHVRTVIKPYELGGNNGD